MPTEAGVLALEQALHDSMVAGDLAALDWLIADHGSYVHSDGVCESRTQLLEAIRSGKYTYDLVQSQTSEITLAPRAAISCGLVRMSVGPAGAAKTEVLLWSTLIWIHEHDRWRLLRRHATRVPVPLSAAAAPSAAASACPLRDKDAIREVMARYCHALDSGRFDAVATLFAPDGEWTTDYGAATGPAEIERFLTGLVPRKGEGPQRKHYITNTVIELDGNSASAVSDYLIIREADDGLIPVMGGTYRDRFVRHDGAWLFQRKELVHDIVGDMALKPR